MKILTQLSALPTKLEELKADENVQGQPQNFMGAPHGAPTHRPSWTSAFGRLLRWALSFLNNLYEQFYSSIQEAEQSERTTNTVDPFTQAELVPASKA